MAKFTPDTPPAEQFSGGGPDYTEPTPEPEETPEPEKEAGGLNPAVLLAVLVLLGGGGALAYFKLVKGKQASTKGPDDLDDYDYGEDDEEYEDSLADDEDEDGEDKGT